MSHLCEINRDIVGFISKMRLGCSVLKHASSEIALLLLEMGGVVMNCLLRLRDHSHDTTLGRDSAQIEGTPVSQLDMTWTIFTVLKLL